MERAATDQAGVAARRQLLAARVTDSDIRRLLRRRELAVVLPGVYVDHTGDPSWLQRAWAAVLYAWPAALCDQSALMAYDGPARAGRDDVIHVAVDVSRRVRRQPGLVVHRRTGLSEQVMWNLGPPRLRYEEAVLDLALAAEPLDAIAVLAAACGGRRTTASRLATAVAARNRVPGRAWITGVLEDAATGTCSVLEHGYLHRVERAHGLPAARRQVRSIGSAGVTYRDAEHPGLVVVELDGRLFHDSASARDRDLERDLDSAVGGRMTLRLGWGQVFERPCSTAAKVSALLRLRGWHGVPRPCGPACSLSGNFSSPGDQEFPP